MHHHQSTMWEKLNSKFTKSPSLVPSILRKPKLTLWPVMLKYSPYTKEMAQTGYPYMAFLSLLFLELILSRSFPRMTGFFNMPRDFSTEELATKWKYIYIFLCKHDEMAGFCFQHATWFFHRRTGHKVKLYIMCKHDEMAGFCIFQRFESLNKSKLKAFLKISSFWKWSCIILESEMRIDNLMGHAGASRCCCQVVSQWNKDS